MLRQRAANFMRRTNVTTWGRLNRPVRMYRGKAMAGIIADESWTLNARGNCLEPPCSFFSYFTAPARGPEFTTDLQARWRGLVAGEV